MTKTKTMASYMSPAPTISQRWTVLDVRLERSHLASQAGRGIPLDDFRAHMISTIAGIKDISL